MNRARSCVIGSLAMVAACGVAPDEDAPVSGAAQAVTLSQVTSFGSNPGNLKMFVYVPSGLPAGAPLVVAMHGCTESASVYSTQTEWGNLADRFRFAVVFPEQQSANNSSSCFNWFQPGDISRGQGEALSIKQMVDAMKSSQGSDPARIFVTGMSAGGFMTEVMMAAYPDVFAGGAVNSGGPYACATSLPATSACQQGNVSRTPQQWGDLVRNAFPGHAGPFPRLVAFHGGSDFTVAAADLQQSVDQWSNVLGIDETPEVNETFRTATHKVFRDPGGRAMIETYLLSGVGHALSVDPGTGPDQGGATGAFSEDHNIYSSFYAAQFWGLTASQPGGDTVAPTVSIASPAAGATVSGTIAVAVNASDDVGVTRVEVYVDGGLAGTDTAAPYAVAVDTTGRANGAHTLTAKAFDAANNAGTSAAVIVTVQNDGGGGGGALLETFSNNGSPDNAGWTLGGFTLTAAKDATGTTGSRSITAMAAPAFNTVTRTATWAGLSLGAAPKLSYVRQLALSDANITASAGLRVIVNDGADHVVDAKAISGFASYSEPAFTARTVDLSAFAGKTVALKLVVTASDSSSTVTRATAWIDQIQIQ